MIKLQNLDKFYNKNRANEIHVINDISLTLPAKGLVVLLGPSGSGKTTLLNVLGGLDKVQKGSIDYDGQMISRYKSKTWDTIRNRNVGYVFQNYNLLTNMTVYDNIALTLNMVGIIDKAEIDKRIDYILEEIGMINYRRRKASQLSGGQQQRVAIARALAKNPKVIIADEPTGNLDSKNTIDIMNIIKKISQEKLVVLVTHEEDIANFYADRVIRLRDGQIVDDYTQSSNGDIDIKHDTDIYLKDLNSVSDMKGPQTNITVYADEAFETDINVRLIIKNKTLYIDLKNDDYHKIQLLGKDSEVKIFDKHYESLKMEEISSTSFDFESIIDESKVGEKQSVISIKESLRITWQRMQGASRMGKLFYAGFALGAILIAFAVGMMSHILTSDPSDFLTGPKEAVIIDKGENDIADLLAFEEESSIGYVNFIRTGTLNIKLPTIFQAYENFNQSTVAPIDKDFLDTDKLMLGRNVEAHNEIVVDKRYADAHLSSWEFENLGITSYEAYLNLPFTLELNDGSLYEFTIVGMVDDDSPVVYTTKEAALMIATRMGIYEIFEDEITVERGDLTETGLVYFVEDSLIPGTTLPDVTVLEFGEDLVLSATFTGTDVPNALYPYQTVYDLYVADNYDSAFDEVEIYSTDVDETLAFFASLGIDAESLLQEQARVNSASKLQNSLGTLIFSIVALSGSSISFFFIIRSSLLSRIYEVSVYRALGVSKGDIRKIFAVEVLFITTITSFLGYAVTTYFLWRIQLASEDFFDFLHISFFSIVGGLVLIYGINLLSGLFPVSNLLRKTPAEILSKYDF